ncbi:MAG TPA: hypothetical protein VHN82_02300 [Methanoregula sp.]|nr:hypothetical protein [Methanoregula sp.]
MTGPGIGNPLHICYLKEDCRRTAANAGNLLLVDHQFFVIAGTRNQTDLSL